MKTKICRLPNAELAVMQALWQVDAPATRPELDALLSQEKGWVPTTILNLIARLERKGFVVREKKGKGYLYSALVSKAEYLQEESGRFLESMFDGSAKQFVAALYDNNTLTRQDVDELAAYLKQLQEE